MKISRLFIMGISLAITALVAGVAISAQDKYTVKVPGGLAFSEFRGYEGWPVIAISQNGKAIAVIVGNPVMIDAYQGRRARQWQAVPRRRQDGESPLDPKEAGGVSRSADGAGRPA